MKKIFVSGSLAFDRIMDFDGLFGDHILPNMTHAINVSFMVPILTESYGGNAGNISYTLTLLGENATILGSAGNDFAPYEAWLAAHKIDTSLIQKDSTMRTAFATIMTDKNDNQITAFYPGAMQVPFQLDKVPFSDAAMVVVSPSNVETMRALPEACRKNSIPFVFDPGQQIPALSGDDLKNGIEGAKALILNDYELQLVMQKTLWSEEEILAHCEILVVTFGEKGSRIRRKADNVAILAAKPKAIVDPTGAGDAYRAGFVVGLIKGWDLDKCAKLGSVVACYTVETEGTQKYEFTKEAVAARYKENYQEDISL